LGQLTKRLVVRVRIPFSSPPVCSYGVLEQVENFDVSPLVWLVAVAVTAWPVGRAGTVRTTISFTHQDMELLRNPPNAKARASRSSSAKPR
jgi:hypothetical protein